MSPHEVGKLSFWEFLAAVEGYAKANSAEPDGPAPPTPERFAEVLAADLPSSIH